MSAIKDLRANFGQALQPVLQEAASAAAISPLRMAELVERVLDKVGRAEEGEAGWRTEVRRTTIDRTLEDIIINVALERAEPTETELQPVFNLLDLILSFSERDYADSALPLVCLTSLLEIETIQTCQHLFNYIELRRDRITKDMLPQRGKGPVLLRMLNELLRRLPKSKPEHVVFSGRILMFLSSVFPLGEKSGVNLRGMFNVAKETVFEAAPAPASPEAGKGAEAVERMEVEGGASAADDFYTTFWSLQRFFSNPPLLFAPATSPVASTSAAPQAEPFAALQHGLARTLTEFAGATKKERALSGKADGKQKAVAVLPEVAAAEQVAVELGTEGGQLDHYFFPKFLTSRNLLELEVADPAFRRQILVQTLILFQYLLACTPEARAAAQPVTNQSALSPFVLGPDNEKWIRAMKLDALNELGKMDRGSHFKQTVELILSRDQNWVSWKLRNCVPFEKAGLDPAAVSDRARAGLAAATRKPKAFPYKLGNPTLSRLWERNLTSLDDFNPSQPEDGLDGLIRKWSLANRQLVGKRTQLRLLAPGAGQRAELAGQVAQLDVRARALHWRAIRLASLSHLHLFAKIRAGELELLVKVMEEERQKEMEEEERREAQVEKEAAGEVEVEVKGEEGGAEAGQKEDEESEVALGTGGLTPPPPPTPAAPEPQPELSAAAPESAQLKDEAKMEVEELEAADFPPEVDPAAEAAGDKEVVKGAEPAAGQVVAPPGVPAVVAALMSKPGTPKRPREGEDEDMAEGTQVSAKKAKVEMETKVEVEELEADVKNNATA